MTVGEEAARFIRCLAGGWRRAGRVRPVVAANWPVKLKHHKVLRKATVFRGASWCFGGKRTDYLSLGGMGAGSGSSFSFKVLGSMTKPKLRSALPAGTTP